MRIAIRHPKDFCAGLIFTASGLAFGILAQGYEMGTATRMGPAYFPTILAVVLVIIGLATVIRAFVIDGPPIQGFALKAAILALGPVVLFGFILRGAGLVLALLPLVMISAYASARFKWIVAIPLALALTGFAILVFILGIGLPIPIVGRWLD
jgi:Tripartite tricarboxylate transporter TctB family